MQIADHNIFKMSWHSLRSVVYGLDEPATYANFDIALRFSLIEHDCLLPLVIELFNYSGIVLLSLTTSSIKLSVCIFHILMTLVCLGILMLFFLFKALQSLAFTC